MTQKIYISGRISGLPFDEVKSRFDCTEATLEALGYEVLNPLKNGLSADAPWSDHMAVDIAMLLKADIVFMLDDWQVSKGARIEHYIAKETGKRVYYGQFNSSWNH